MDEKALTLNAREADDAGGGVDEAADEEALGGGLARGVLADLGVELVGAHHVAALGYNSIGFKPVPNNVGSFETYLDFGSLVLNLSLKLSQTLP